MGARVREFDAAMVGADVVPELGAFVIVLAEGNGLGARLEFQRPLAKASEEGAGYFLCTEDGAAFCGGVSRWSLVDAVLEIALEETAEAAFGVEAFRVRLGNVDVAALESLRGALTELLTPRDRANVASTRRRFAFAL